MVNGFFYQGAIILWGADGSHVLVFICPVANVIK